MILIILGLVIALIAFSIKMIFDLTIFPTLAGFLFVFYIVYSWFDYLFFKSLKKIYKENIIFPRLKTGLEPTAYDLNLDLSNKILDKDYTLNSNDSD